MADSESDDNENESGIGNLTRAVMRPPGQSGKAKKGHLCFDASFESGNLGKVELINEFEYDLYIRPDSCNGRYRFWFNFTIDNTKSNQRVILNLVNISKPQNRFCNAMTPLVRTSSRRKWYRIALNRVYYHKSPIHNFHYVLTVLFCFDKEDQVYQFALNYPYSYTRLQCYLKSIEEKQYQFFKRELLASSIEKRRIDVLTISDERNLLLTTAENCRVVIIMARIHPADSPTSYICEGILQCLLSSYSIAAELRRNVIFIIIPMINPDGVVLGNYKCDLLGVDLNKAWDKISQWSHPALHAIKTLIMKLHDNKRIALDFIIDLEAHSNLCGVVGYGNVYADVYRNERHSLFLNLLAKQINGFEKTFTIFNKDPKLKSTARRYFYSILKDNSNSYTIFVSLDGFTDKRSKRFISFTENGYLKFYYLFKLPTGKYLRGNSYQDHKLYLNFNNLSFYIENVLRSKPVQGIKTE